MGSDGGSQGMRTGRERTDSMKNKNIVVVQNLIRRLPIEVLKDSEVVANLVRAFGLV